ncbi:MAG TPA: glycoside hydrolase family 43 protein [Chloroflexia bacterium]|nr:glycoside hydrolase family 43 protein [Chloroflexia bacterium]
MNTIKNPILRGFNPDPSILRVGDDYYIAASTFEWFPGVQIHHSRDLVNWHLLTHPLTRVSQLDLSGNPNSAGVWAPDLSYHDGLFYLIYTNVRSLDWIYNDTHNYLVTAPDIMGPWSEPIYLNSSGFDPSLFHDDDGRKWLLNMQWDFRPERNTFAGILIQEYSPAEQKLVGPIHNIFKGTSRGLTEGPHLYKRDGYYHLLTAEGGTVYEHAVTMARSKNILGPYEIHPQNPVLTSAANRELALQKAGHASLVETQNGEWYMAHLVGRPLKPQWTCNLGRETALQKCYWSEDGWLRLSNGGNEPEVEVQGPDLPAYPFEPEPERYDFDSPELSIHFNSLRVPVDESWASLTERPGYLRLRGRESLSSWQRQSLLARRQQAFRCEAETCLEFDPQSFQQMAGLICLYDTRNYFYLCVSNDEEAGKSLRILDCDRGKYSEPLARPISLVGVDRIYLKVILDYHDLQFYFSSDSQEWHKIGPVFPATRLSDEYCATANGSFTGAFIGMCVQDLSGRQIVADFDYFAYQEFPEDELPGQSADSIYRLPVTSELKI